MTLSLYFRSLAPCSSHLPFQGPRPYLGLHRLLREAVYSLALPLWTMDESTRRGRLLLWTSFPAK